MGTLILTIAGFLTRILGLFYRIFLSHSIGSEGMGIYQLIFPIHSLAFSLSAAAIQTAISKFVAEKSTSENKKEPTRILTSGLILSLLISLLTAFILYFNADFIATMVLKESSCADLLRYLAYTIPLGGIHSCISGYYLGYKKAGIPAWSQLIEQIIRVSSVYIIATVIISQGGSLSPAIAVLGSVIGEGGSALFCIFAVRIDILKNSRFVKEYKSSSIFSNMKNILTMSVPMTLNRIMLNIFQSAEAILVPFKLQAFGLSSSEALSVYGVLTGMAMPFIFFPSAITNSIAVMLLPAVAEAQYTKDNKITTTTDKSLKYSIILGIFCTGIFIVYGNDMGNIVFGNKDAGIYIMILSWLCPFLYISSTLASILHGIGKTTVTFIHNMIATLIRIGFLVFLVPKVGIIGYLWGLLISQLVISFLHLAIVKKHISMNFSSFDWILKPSFYLLASLSLGYFSKKFLFHLDILPGLINILISGILTTVMFWLIILKKEKKKSYYI